MEITKSPVNNSLAGIDVKEGLYSAVIQNTLEGFVILSLKGDILDANEAFSRMNGYSRDDLLSMKIYDLSPHKITADSYAEYIKDHIKQGGASFETCHKCKDGRIIDVKVSSKYLDVNGGIFFSFHSDITEQKKRDRQKERSLKEVEDRYRAIIELGTKIGEAIVMLQDIDGREGMHTYVSDQWATFTGYLREELLAMSFFDLVKPEDKESSIQRHRQKMSGKAIPNLVELSIIHKDGHEVPVELTSASTFYNKQSVNMMYIRDITERKKAEILLRKYQQHLEEMVKQRTEELRRTNNLLKEEIEKRQRSEEETQFILDNVPAYIVMKDKNKQYLRVNQLVKKALLPEESVFTGKTMGQVFVFGTSQQYIKREDEDDQKVIDTGISMTTVVKHKLPKGGVKWVKIDRIPYIDKHGNVSGIVELAIDITDLKVAQEKSRRLLKKEKELRLLLEGEVENRIEFTRALVHELKTPLTSINLSSELLREEINFTSPQQRLVENIYSSSIFLDKRIGELLDMAQVETGILKLSTEYIDPKALFIETIEEIRPIIDSSGQSLAIDLPGSLTTICADKLRLKEILHNLLSNAVNYNRNEGRITASAFEDEKYVIFKIQDEGPGIGREDRKIIFKPYQRLEGDDGNMRGLGLGLAISKNLVELHGGKIGLRSRKGKGSTFFVMMPKISNQRDCVD